MPAASILFRCGLSLAQLLQLCPTVFARLVDIDPFLCQQHRYYFGVAFITCFSGVRTIFIAWLISIPSFASSIDTCISVVACICTVQDIDPFLCQQHRYYFGVSCITCNTQWCPIVFARLVLYFYYFGVAFITCNMQWCPTVFLRLVDNPFLCQQHRTISVWPASLALLSGVQPSLLAWLISKQHRYYFSVAKWCMLAWLISIPSFELAIRSGVQARLISIPSFASSTCINIYSSVV